MTETTAIPIREDSATGTSIPRAGGEGPAGEQRRREQEPAQDLEGGACPFPQPQDTDADDDVSAAQRSLDESVRPRCSRIHRMKGG